METIEILGYKAEVARTFAERARGLIGRRSLAPDEGMLILKCNAIHTWFMRFPIDAIFLDSHDRIVRIVRNIRPWRLFIWGGFRAVKVLEISCNCIKENDERGRNRLIALDDYAHIMV